MTLVENHNICCCCRCCKHLKLGAEMTLSCALFTSLKRTHDQVDRMTVETDGRCVGGSVKQSHNRPFKLTSRIRQSRRCLLAILYICLLINFDLIRAQRVLRTMMITRLLNKSLTRPSRFGMPFGLGASRSGGHSLNTAEAVALIHAINSNNNNNQLNSNNMLNDLMGAPANARYTSGANGLMMSPNGRQRQMLLTANERQQIATRPAAAVGVLAALATFLAAVFAGFRPFAAVFVAIFAAFFAFFVAILAVIIPPRPPVPGPIIKKLVIKKTVVPFVIPIPIKKKEEKIVYVNKKEHKKEHEHSESNIVSTIKKKTKPSIDALEVRQRPLRLSSDSQRRRRKFAREDANPLLAKPPPSPASHISETDANEATRSRAQSKRHNHNDAAQIGSSLDQIESVLSEQDHIQNMLYKVIDAPSDARAAKAA